MRIERIFIEGFGIFCDFDSGPLAPGMCVVYGENESGKSTLLDFVRFVLFGYATRGRERRLHPPLRGGRHGGRLELLADDGNRYTVERIKASRAAGDPRVSAAGGGETAVESLVSPNLRSLFKNVFGFSLTELQEFDSLAGEEVVQYLLGTMMGSDLSLARLKADLADRMKSLFKQKGKGQNLVNDDVLHLREVYGRMRLIEEETGRYDELNEELAARRGDSDALSSRRNGLAQLSIRDRRLRELACQRAALLEEAEAREAAAEGLPVDERLLPPAARIESLERRRERFEADLAARPGLENAVEEERRRIDGAASELGEGWTLERIREFDLSIPALDEFERLAGSIEDAKKRLATLDEAVTGRRDEHERAVKAREKARKTLEETDAPELDDEARIDDRRDGFRRLGVRLNELAVLEQGAADLEDGLEREKAHQASLRAIAGKGGSAPLWPVALLEALGLAGVAAGAIARSWVGIILGAVLVLAGAFYYFLGYRRGLARAGVEESDRVEALGRRLEERRAGIAAEKAAVAEAAARLGLEAPDSERIMDGMRRLDRVANDLAAYRSLEKDLAGKEEAERTLAAELEEKSLRVEKIERSLSACEADMAGWLRDRGLGRDLALDSVRRALGAIEKAKGALDALEKDRASLVELRERIETFAAEAADALRECGRDVPAAEEFAGEIGRLYADLQQARTNSGKRKVLRDDAAALSGKAEGVRGDIREMIAARREIVETFSLASDLQVEELDEAGDLSADELETRLQGEEAALEKLIEQVDLEIKQANQEIGGIRKELSLIESERSLADTVGEEGDLLRRIESSAREWAVLAVADFALRKAREKYERANRPEVLERAERFLARMTGGRYREIRVSTDGGLVGDSITVVDSSGGERGIDELSRGTAEQLYLALRFGYIEKVSAGAPAFPVVADEVLVNFDSGRIREAVAGLADLSRTHQVLLLTCHPETVALVGSVLPDARVLHLEDGRLVDRPVPAPS